MTQTLQKPPTKQASVREIEKFSLKKWDIIITKDSEISDDIAKPALVIEDLSSVICGYHLAILRPKTIHGPFLAQLLGIPEMRHKFSRVANGVTRFGIGLNAINGVELRVPNCKVQKNIASILQSVDRAIAGVEDLIVEKRRLNNALIELLLSGKRRLPGCETQWSERCMGDLAEINPRTPMPLSSDVNVSFVPMANIRVGGGLISDTTRPFREVVSGFTAFQDGDVLVSKITPCFENRKGALAEGLSNGYGFGTTELHVLRAKPCCSSRFLFYVSMSRGFRCRGAANMTGSAGQRRVPTGFVRSYRLRVPGLPEQKRIADFLAMAERNVQLLETKRTTLLRLKTGLAQRLFSGALRSKLI